MGTSLTKSHWIHDTWTKTFDTLLASVCRVFGWSAALSLVCRIPFLCVCVDSCPSWTWIGVIRKIASGVAPRLSRKPHSATLPQTMVGTLYLWWRLRCHNHLWYHKFIIISLWATNPTSELLHHTRHKEHFLYCCNYSHYYRNNCNDK
jgi:hypothetical protein